jgi:hypothetical protein
LLALSSSSGKKESPKEYSSGDFHLSGSGLVGVLRIGGLFFGGLCGFHEEAGHDLGSFTCALGAGFYLCLAGVFKTMMEYAAAGGLMMRFESIVDLLSEVDAGLGAAAGIVGTAEQDARRHDGAGKRTTGTTGPTHAAAKAGSHFQKFQGAVLAAVDEKGFHYGFGTVEPVGLIEFFSGFARIRGEIFVKSHEDSFKRIVERSSIVFFHFL